MMTIELSRKQQERQATLDQMNQLAWLLDNSIRIPILNYRIGLDAIIGLIPGVSVAVKLHRVPGDPVWCPPGDVAAHGVQCGA
jgi:hypothetical protein